MSEELSTSAPFVSTEPASQSRPSRETGRHLLAALFSAIVPGGGQFFLGQKRKDIVLLSGFVLLLVGFWPMRLLRFYAGFLALFSAWIGVYIYAVCDAQLARHRPRSDRPSRWWLVATLPLTLFTLSQLGGVVTRASGFRSFSIPSTSMEKTLRKGDHFVVDVKYRLPKRQEVIVFFKDQIYFVKRVGAIGGDSIKGEGGVIFVNGNIQDEPYVEHIGQETPDWMNNFGPVTIPKDKYFVMGDNRDVSLDSRSTEFGFVDTGSIIGKPLYVFGSDLDGRSIR